MFGAQNRKLITETTDLLLPNNKNSKIPFPMFGDMENDGDSVESHPLLSIKKHHIRKYTEESEPVIHHNKQSIIPVIEQQISKPYLGYLLILLWNFTDSGSLILSQLTIGELTIFELLLFRYSILTPALFVAVKKQKLSLSFSSLKDFFEIVMIALSKQVYVTLYFFTPSLVPVGNVYAVFVSFTLLFSAVVDSFLGQLKKISIFAICVTMTGLVIYTQVWNKQMDTTSTTQGCTPCLILQSDPCTVNITLNKTNPENSTFTAFTLPKGLKAYFLHTFDTTLLGYILLIFSSLSVVAADNIFRHMTSKHYSDLSLMFWLSFTQWLISLVVCISIYRTSWPMPTGIICNLTSVVLVLVLCVGFLTNLSLKYFPVSYVYLGLLPVNVILYVSQRTFLSSFLPGYGNMLEVFGMLLVTIGSALTPLYSVISDKYKKIYKSKKRTRLEYGDL